MTTRRPAASRLTERLRGIGYRGFYRLPPRVRRRLVRIVAPTYTVGAVVMVRDTDERLLLLRQPPGHGWTLPGGILSRGERPAECAARELAEETGLRLAADEISPAVPNAVVHPRTRSVDLVYETRIDPARHEITVDGHEVIEARWYPPASLPPLTVPTARLLAQFGLGPYQGYPEVLYR